MRHQQQAKAGRQRDGGQIEPFAIGERFVTLGSAGLAAAAENIGELALVLFLNHALAMCDDVA